MANGRVITGYSQPKVAVYNANNGEPKYTGYSALARGVSVSMDVETSDSQDFYADNVLAESAGGQFTGGTVSLTVDGLKEAARKLIMGLPAETEITVGEKTVKVQEYDDRMKIPYVGIGFVVRYMENGVTSYMPVVLTKCIFDVDGLEANTQEEDVEFQPTELSATMTRDDSANHRWRRLAEAQPTEAEAEAVLAVMLGE